MRHSRKGLNPVKVPFAMKVADPVMREWVGDVREAIRGLAARNPQSAPLRLGGGGVGNRFRFGGLYKDDSDKWRVRISPGSINYHEVFHYGDFGGQKSKAQYVRGVFPTIDVDGDDVRIDDPSKPALELGDRDSASVWLVARKDQCNSSSLGNGRLVISDRDEDPEDVESNEDAYLIVDFDVEETDGGGKRATEVYKYLQSDLVQNYACDKGGSSDDSYDGSDMDGSSDFYEGSSSAMGSTPSGSSDEDSDDENNPCRVYATAGWENAVTCFPPRPDDPEVPASFDFTIRVRFHFAPDFSTVNCAGFAYGAKLEGGIIVGETLPNKDGEYRWRDDVDRVLTWRVAKPPNCGYLRLTWRVKSFPPEPDPLGFPITDPGCCNQNFPNSWNDDKNGTGGTIDVIMRQYVSTGPWDRTKKKMPHVCGKTCSSSGVGGEGGGGA